MSKLDLALDRIEILIAEIEELDRVSCGQFRQADDREAGDILSRIERRFAGKQGVKNAQ